MTPELAAIIVLVPAGIVLFFVRLAWHWGNAIADDLFFPSDPTDPDPDPDPKDPPRNVYL